MKKEVIALFYMFFSFGFACLVNAQTDLQDIKLTQNQDDFLDEEEDAALELDREQDEKVSAKSLKKKELDSFREASANTTEYTLDPSSVELVVEMDPSNYGFRMRTHRMTLMTEFDLIMRGRAFLYYDYRFFEHLSFGPILGVDWTEVSIYGRFREYLTKVVPNQFAILGGVAGKWRLTEWYMHSSIFLKPSLLFGHMWQTLVDKKSQHWRFRPGLFAGIETVFNSGLACSTSLGVEIPIDFGEKNPYKEIVEPVLLFSFGFAI
jgi:hypothetical protein